MMFGASLYLSRLPVLDPPFIFVIAPAAIFDLISAQGEPSDLVADLSKALE